MIDPNPSLESLWTYRARVLKIVDGDTVDLEVDEGFHGRRIERMRLLYINAPEVHGATRAAGDAATAFTRDWLSAATGSDWPLTIRTSKSDVFGRWLVVVWRQGDPVSLNQALLVAGHAVPYDP